LTRFLFVLVTGVLGIVLYFFRDPNRVPRQDAGMVVSPADGKVMAIVREREGLYLEKEVIRISIFLSLFDVHVQRMPIGGKVLQVDHRPGQFLQAFRPEASEVNESVAMIIESPYGQVLVKQIAGILARRCVNYANVGDMLETGHRFGMIRFSSRVDVFLPPESELLVSVGDRVTGGLTPMARFRR
jgi:phosphatidylserine decarboxylase